MQVAREKTNLASRGHKLMYSFTHLVCPRMVTNQIWGSIHLFAVFFFFVKSLEFGDEHV